MTKIAIIGGGIAGIAAAEALLRSGLDCRITLLESRRAGGGRAGSFHDPATNEQVDYCQHVAMGCCTNLLDLVRRTGSIEHFTRYDQFKFYHPGDGLSDFRPDRRLPAPLHLNAALSGLKHIGRSDRTRIRWAIARLMRQTESSLQDVTAGDWLRKNHQSPESRTRFWDVILASALGDQPEHVSMSAARKVIVDGFAGAHGASDVWVPNRSLAEIFDSAMLGHLRRGGVDVRTGQTVRGVRFRTDQGKVELDIGDPSPFEANHVIIATSWRAAQKLIETLGVMDDASNPAQVKAWQAETCEFLSSIIPSPITGLHLWFDRPITDQPHVVMVGTISHWLFRQPIRGTPPTYIPQNNRAEQDKPAEPTGVYHQVVVSGRHRLSDASKETLVRAVVEELRQAFTGAVNGSVFPQLLSWRVVTDPNAVYRVSPEFQSRRPSTSTPLPWLTLAGDYLQTGWPATMEGATISGRMAADAVRRHHGQGQPTSKRSVSLPTLVTPALRRGILTRWLIT